MSAHGYYRSPTINGEHVVFVCEDDLWTVSLDGSVARRLTANLNEADLPRFSPDGNWVAFTGREDGGPEVYVVPATGGEARRLTYLGAEICNVVTWHPETSEIIFASDAAQPFRTLHKLFAVNHEGGLPRELPYGQANSIAFGADGRSVLGRHRTKGPQHWKRYRGGTQGRLWLDSQADRTFRELSHLPGNIASPMWIADRIYYLSDHEEVGNLYSCDLSGEDVRKHTYHDGFYACNASTDGSRIVYHSGGDLWSYDVAAEESRQLHVSVHSPQTQRTRRFVSVAEFLESYEPSSDGKSLAIVSRGKLYSAHNWDGPAIQHGVPDGVRYRLATWLPNDDGLVAVTDESGEEALCVFDSSRSKTLLGEGKIGRPVKLEVSPRQHQVAISNHRGELLVANLDSEAITVLDQSRFGRIAGMSWSPDGRWLAYGMPTATDASIIKLCHVETGKTFPATSPVLLDSSPSFDPDGRYLYFLSRRIFDPVYDNLQFELSFPRGMRPYLITLQADTPSPFLGRYDPPHKSNQQSQQASESMDFRIDLKGIEHRVVPFPVEEAKYDRIEGIPGGRVFFSSFPIEGSRHVHLAQAPASTGTIQRYDFAERTKETWAEKVVSFRLSRNGEHLVYRSKDKLRTVSAQEKPKEEKLDQPRRKSGWLDLNRFKVSVDPTQEWPQMFAEAWRLVRDQYWRADMQGLDWQGIRDRYSPLVDRIASQSEFADLIWELQGELGTSHAYLIGGDARKGPDHQVGHLGADFEYDETQQGYRIRHIVNGDPWDEDRRSPLQSPGLNIAPGDFVHAVNGQPLSRQVTPSQLLVNVADSEVSLAVSSDGQSRREVVVKTLKAEQPARYREWVETNREYVHEATAGRVGYVHIPNMVAEGFAEFHRYWTHESLRDGLVVDVRFNSGGHVSQLLLEKLRRQRWGYCVSRWQETRPHPDGSMVGPIVALTNEQAGSDGDIFSHCFKLAGIGPLIGKRTWGGTIGIFPRHPLVDGALTTQPEFAFWFSDVEFGLENHGAEPDIEVASPPHEEAQGKDLQLDRAIAEVEALLAAAPTLDIPE